MTKSTTNPKINATLQMNRKHWEELNQKAKQLGLSRTKLLTQIATGKIKIEKTQMIIEEEELLGEF